METSPAPETPSTPAHPVFNGPFTPITTSFTGGSFSHASVHGGGISPILLDDTGDASLAELRWGLGAAPFGGMTTDNFHQPQPEAANLRANILAYAASFIPPITIVEPDVDAYTLDLTGFTGRPLDIVLAGHDRSFSGETLQLLAPDGRCWLRRWPIPCNPASRPATTTWASSTSWSRPTACTRCG